MGGADTVDCGAQFAMLKSIKLHGGKTQLNTIKAIKAGKRQIYKQQKKKRRGLRPSHAKYQELLTSNEHKKIKQISSELVQKKKKEKTVELNLNRTDK